MSLPGITAPPGTPAFLVAGHGIAEDSVFAKVKFATGHSRSRRVYTVPQRVVSVSLILEPDVLAEYDNWFENTLLAGSLEFAAQVKNQGPGLLWWRARWVDFYTELLPYGRGRVIGTLFLTGEGSVDGPNTGALSMEVAIDLLDIRSSLATPTGLSMEVLIELLQPLGLSMEVSIDLLHVYLGRATEDGDPRITEDGESRILES